MTPTLDDYGHTYDQELDRERLGRVDGTVYDTLQQAGTWVTRWRLVQTTRGAVIHSSIARLRKKGARIESRRDPRNPSSGNWQYRLIEP